MTPDLSSLIQGWVTDPASNLGLVLRWDESAASTVLYTLASVDHATVAYRPKLTVTYTTATALVLAEVEAEAEWGIILRLRSGQALGSQALTLTSAGARLATNTELRYYPYGVARYTAGTTPTTFNFTGQRKDSGSGLLFYNARWYDLYRRCTVPTAGNRFSGLGMAACDFNRELPVTSTATVGAPTPACPPA